MKHPLRVLFTRTLVDGNIGSVVSKYTTGLGNSETYKRTGASIQRLFLRPRLAARKTSLSMGLCGADFGQAGILYASSFQPCTVPTISDWKPEQWVKRQKYKAWFMANKQSFPVDDVTFLVCRARSILKALQVAAESSDEFQLHKHDTAHILHLAEDVLNSAYDKIVIWEKGGDA